MPPFDLDDATEGKRLIDCPDYQALFRRVVTCPTDPKIPPVVVPTLEDENK